MTRKISEIKFTLAFVEIKFSFAIEFEQIIRRGSQKLFQYNTK